MANSQDRRAAQRRTAREVRTGTYRPSPQLNKARRVSAALSTPPSRLGQGEAQVRDFTRLDEAEKFARALPSHFQSYILAFGQTLHPDKYEGKSQTWAALSQWQNRSHYTAEDTTAISAKRKSVFDDHATRYRVVFR